MRWLFIPLHLIRDLPIAAKLASTTLGALTLLTGVSLFAVNRLNFVANLQQTVSAQSLVEQEVQRGLSAADELRVISRELQTQQTVTDVRVTLESAEKQWQTATETLRSIQAGPDQPLLDTAMTRLNALIEVVRHAAALRTGLLTARQKRIFQARAVFDSALATVTAEASDTHAKGLPPGVSDAAAGAVHQYGLAMTRLQASLMMFLATGSPSAANAVRDATADAGAAMSQLQSGLRSDTLKQDARMLDAIGGGLAAAASDLIAQSRQLDQVVQGDVESASQDMRAALHRLSESAVNRQKAAVSDARAAAGAATHNIRLMILGIAILMLSLGAVVTWLLAHPLRRLADTVQAIAAGKTDLTVPSTAGRDETGRVAAAIEELRKVMEKTFIQAQIIDQLPVGVMTANSADHRITYLNPETRRILATVQDRLPIPLDRLVGTDIDTIHGGDRQRRLASDPANLPCQTRIDLGAETIDIRVSAMFDRTGAFAGPLLVWRSATRQKGLVRQFDDSIGTIARIVAESANAMRDAASAMRQSAMAAGTRTLAVAAAARQASSSVTTAAAGAEEVAVSVNEIARQVAESAQIAATAVAEARATDASVGSLNEAADRISAVVRLISDIAARTNLLALNATIEAARAGEAGKGFAVVAGEVKNLANQTAKATEEIGGQIAAMQSATAEAVTALRSIGATIQRMNDIATVIAGSVEEQGAATQSIAQAVGNAAAGTAEVDSNVASVTAVVEETGNQAGDVLAAATRMTEQAATLKAEAARFLVAVQQAA